MNAADINPIDRLMEDASQRLVRRDYLGCERQCLEALRMAREAEDFQRLGRILMPLQEARRQRRQLAADHGVIVLGEPKCTPEELLDRHREGCLLLLDPPYGPEDEDRLRTEARRREQLIEVLRMNGDDQRSAFLRGMEEKGDAVLSNLSADLTPLQRIDAILEKLDVIGDHEIAHQRLAEAAKQVASELAGQRLGS